MRDLIEREAAVRAIETERDFPSWPLPPVRASCDRLLAKVRALPSIGTCAVTYHQLPPDTDFGAWECSGCHLSFCFEEGAPSDHDTHFCPNCGGRIEVEVPYEPEDGNALEGPLDEPSRAQEAPK